MADGQSEYGGRNEGELVRRPSSPILPPSPHRTYHPDYYPPPEGPSEPNFSRPQGLGLRRKVSQGAQRRPSLEYDQRPSFSSSEPQSRKPLRPREDPLHADDYHHPDAYDRSRPPRTHRNQDFWDRGLSTASKPYWEESRKNYRRERDLERGEWGHEIHRSSSESVDGYDYEANMRQFRSKTFDFNNLTKQEQKQVLRLPFVAWMNSDVKNHFVATIGEFVGTTMFLFFAFAGTQVANIGSNAPTQNPATSNTTSGGATGFSVSVYLYISIIFGFSLMVNVWIFFRISGGLFNPAVTLGMFIVKAIPASRAICLFCAQIAGSIAASGMVYALFPTRFNVRTTLSGGTSLVQGVFIEAILTAELVFTIFMLAKEKHKATFIAPVGIGLALFIAEMVGVYYTGGSLNPARSIGPCIVTVTFDKDHWIYWVGPIIGTFIAIVFYKFIKMLEYEMANPGQDGDDENDPTKNDEKRNEIMGNRAAMMGGSARENK